MSSSSSTGDLLESSSSSTADESSSSSSTAEELESSSSTGDESSSSSSAGSEGESSSSGDGEQSSSSGGDEGSSSGSDADSSSGGDAGSSSGSEQGSSGGSDDDSSSSGSQDSGSSSGSSESSTGGSAPTGLTICDRITNAMGKNSASALSELEAMEQLTIELIDRMLDNPLTARYFNGSINYRVGSTPQPFESRGPAPNYGTNMAQRDFLVDHLARFFGAGLRCSAVGFSDQYKYSPVYASFGTFSQNDVHANMNIGQEVFSAFNYEAVSLIHSYTPSDSDAAAVAALLASYGRNNLASENMICTAPDCDCAPTVQGDDCDVAIGAAAGLQLPFVTLILAAIFALIAMRR